MVEIKEMIEESKKEMERKEKEKEDIAKKEKEIIKTVFLWIIGIVVGATVISLLIGLFTLIIV